jgi:hypothetical protein
MPILRLRRKTKTEAVVQRDFNQHQSTIVLERSLACVRPQCGDQTSLRCAQIQATAVFENRAEPLFTKLLAVFVDAVSNSVSINRDAITGLNGNGGHAEIS